jgi:type VI secretion system protein ImpB
VQIDRDNFNDVMRRLTPGLKFRVENTIEGNGREMAVNLKFEQLDDFEPGSIVNQVPALKSLLESRNELRDLLSKADRSEDLEVLLEKILQNKGELKQLADELAKNSADGKGN